MKKGNAALRDGQKTVAVSHWKQALAIDPDFAPAKKKIQEVNQALAKKEFEAGYIHNQHGELEDALESWSNAVALDPSYKQKGLLLLMSKIQLQVKESQINRLISQGQAQYHQGLLEDALLTYEELKTLAPRHEEARRMAAKIKIQLGQAALENAQSALKKGVYAEAIEQADVAVKYGYETPEAQAIKSQAERAIQSAGQKKEKKAVAKTAAPQPPAKVAPPPVTSPADAEEAMVHYRRGLSAIRNKDYHLAIQELDIAAQLDPTNERIYISRERARQEWSSSTVPAGSNP
jgi:tetratricopeptide (TPR) repeat protein